VYKHLTLGERDGILVARMNRPRSRNALSLALMQELTDSRAAASRATPCAQSCSPAA